MQYWFYHLEKTSTVAALVPLLERCLKNDWTCLIRAQNPETLVALDKELWTFQERLWLPHAIEGEEGVEPSEQPILLTTSQENNNFAQAVFLLEDAPIGDIDGIERAFYLIDGQDDEKVAAARKTYKAAKEAGFELSYWKQNAAGKWEQVA